MFRSMFTTAFRATALAALVSVSALCSPASAAPPTDGSEVSTKLYELGYPTDTDLAIKRWRADTRRTGEGPLTGEERSALLAQTPPPFFSAMTGNPFTGMGLALRHTKREDAESESIRLCRNEGGGTACNAPTVIRAGICVVVVGYTVNIDRRPHHRVSVAISSDIKLAADRGMEGCQTGATHPQLCRTLITFCGDGTEVNVHDNDKTAEALAR